MLGELSDPYVAGVTHRLAAALPDSTVVILVEQGHGAMFSAPELLASEVQRFIGSISP